ncbi:MAG: cysteine--tRNA ligase, partial [Sphingomonadaceae bacterium]|nr:cysteine--tRNA ligase [Sphingomonadaceae bacterium]
MTIRLYDTMRRAKVDFVPADPARVTMYVCGPTVYGRAHIGNARPAVVFDVLARLLRHTYGPDAVVYARNITDIDDKIIAAAAASGETVKSITDRFEAHYLADMGALGVQPPTLAPHATDYVVERVDAAGRVTGMIPMIADLIAKGAAYAAQGHVLFDVAAPGDYGRLSRRPLDEMIAGARVEVAPYKRNPADFVLWKPSTPAQPGWESPWGRGRPGWHIECSAMIAAELGETIDIHGGGLDLIFPHHENELAQSACAHGAPLARVWLHNGFLSMGGGDKMSKSLGNVVGVDDLLAAGWSGEVIRLALLSAHYRQPLVWSEALLEQSKATLDRWQGYLRRYDGEKSPTSSADPHVLDALADDLNTPAAIAGIAKLIKEDRLEQLSPSMWALGLGTTVYLNATAHIRFSVSGTLSNAFNVAEVGEQIAARTAARACRDFAESDRLRDELAAQGIILEDGPDGTTWRRG